MSSISGQGYQVTSLCGGADINLLDSYYNNTWKKDENINSTKNISCQNFEVLGDTTLRGKVDVVNVNDVNIADRTTIFGAGNITGQNVAIAFDGIPGGYYGLVANGSGNDPVMRLFNTTQSLIGSQVSFTHPGYTRADLQLNQLFGKVVRLESTLDNAIWLDPNGTSYFASYDVTENNNMRLGIGIKAPTAKLHVNNTTTSDSFLVEDEASPDTSPFIIKNDGKVGIGLTAPTRPLHIALNGDNYIMELHSVLPSLTFGCEIQTKRAMGTATTPLPILNGASIYGVFNQGYNGTAYSSNIASHRVIATQDWTTIANGCKMDWAVTANGATSRAVQMTLDQNGNLGIGTATPVEKIDAVGNIRASSGILISSYGTGTLHQNCAILQNLGFSAGASAGLLFRTSHQSGQCSIFGGTTDILNKSYISFRTNSTATANVDVETMRLNHDGNLGIGTTAPSEKLDVVGNAKVSSSMTVGDLINSPSKTTTQRDALVGVVNGSIVYNNTTHKLQVRANGVWVDLH